jgi:hypothetical protein
MEFIIADQNPSLDFSYADRILDFERACALIWDNLKAINPPEKSTKITIRHVLFHPVRWHNN